MNSLKLKIKPGSRLLKPAVQPDGASSLPKEKFNARVKDEEEVNNALNSDDFRSPQDLITSSNDEGTARQFWWAGLGD